MAQLQVTTKLRLKHFDNPTTMEVGEILAGLSERFPTGFYAAEGTKYLQSAIGGVPEEFAGSIGDSAALFYKALAESRLLVSTKEEPAKEGGHVKYKYHVDNAIVEGYFPPEKHGSHTLFVPGGLAKLLDAYSRLVANSPRDSVEGLLERMVLENDGFLRVMRTIKEESPQAYVNMGGRYLDKLLDMKAK